MVNTAKDIVIAKIPVSCLSSAARIKVSPVFKAWYYHAPKHMAYDAGMVKGIPGRTKYSPWIAAG